MGECSSYTMCHVSRVTCHLSRVTCQNIFFFLHFFLKEEEKKEQDKKKKKTCILKKIGQSGGASRWRVCYQRGLPRLV